MQQTRGEFLRAFMAFVGEDSDPTARDVAERLLNLTIKTLWLKHPWRAFQAPYPFVFATVANRAHYSLPAHFGRMTRGKIRNVTRGYELAPITPADLDTGLGLTETPGAPTGFCLRGTCGVHTQPATGGEIVQAVSDNATDTDIVVSVEGEDTNGVQTRQQVTLSGENAVSVGTWRYIDTFGKAYPDGTTPGTELTSSRGAVTLRTASGQAELQKLFAHESARQHEVLRLTPLPDAVYTLSLPFFRRPTRLLRDPDVLPQDWEPAIWEEMLIQWRVNTGDLSLDAAARSARPALLDLIVNDNREAGGAVPFTRPFGGSS